MSLPPNVAIQASALSKKYRLFDSPRQRLKEALDPWGRTFHKDFWALRDIDLTIEKGHTVGILGRNGSGKSTLLQLVTSVLRPTSGRIEVSGRIAALLELGAGFDPDFTGRENIRQYGQIQGLSSAEIETRLPHIEEFAGIGEFFDREVKTYSSGMFARLAFAAAINVDPDVLILDEILAVGDVRFQQRCYDRITKIQDAGKTVLLVSHSMETIIDHCDSAILLDQGRLIARGSPKDVADRYRELLFDETAKQIAEVTTPAAPNLVPSPSEVPPLAAAMLDDPETGDRFPRRPGYNPQETIWGGDDGKILDYRIELDGQEAKTNIFVVNTVVRFYVLVQSCAWHAELQFGMALRRTDGVLVYGCNTTMRPEAFQTWKGGSRSVFAFSCRLNVQNMSYFFDVGLFRNVLGETVRLKTRRNCIQIFVMNTPHFDGVADLAAI